MHLHQKNPYVNIESEIDGKCILNMQLDKEMKAPCKHWVRLFQIRPMNIQWIQFWNWSWIVRLKQVWHQILLHLLQSILKSGLQKPFPGVTWSLVTLTILHIWARACVRVRCYLATCGIAFLCACVPCMLSVCVCLSICFLYIKPEKLANLASLKVNAKRNLNLAASSQFQSLFWASLCYGLWWNHMK